MSNKFPEEQKIIFKKNYQIDLFIVQNIREGFSKSVPKYCLSELFLETLSKQSLGTYLVAERQSFSSK